MKTNNTNINRLIDILVKNGVETFITSDRKWIYYFLGMPTDKANPTVMIVNTLGEIKVITPEKLLSNGVKTFQYSTYSSSENPNVPLEICNILKEIAPELYNSLAVALSTCPAWLFRFLSKNSRTLLDIDDNLAKLAMIKSNEEIHCIRESLKLNIAAYEKIRTSYVQGISEMDIYSLVTLAYNSNTGTPIEFLHDIVSGSRTVEVGGPPTTRKISLGETLIVDLLPCLNNYFCDTTRTFFIRRADEEQIKAYKVLFKAVKCAERILRPGIIAEEVYRNVKGTIENEGYTNMFSHHAGHGIGLNSLEAPYFINQCTDVLKSGMVVTIEPGIYIQGKFGMRIENNYLITPEGYEQLFDYPLDIDYFII